MPPHRRDVNKGRLAALIVVATIAFVIGISLEKSGADHESAAETGSEATEEAVVEGGSEDGHSDGERLLGVSIEATLFVILATAFSLALAAAAWLRPELGVVMAVIALSMLAFTVLDIREIVHQLDESSEGVAVIAAIVALLHGAAAGMAASIGRAASRPAQE